MSPSTRRWTIGGGLAILAAVAVPVVLTRTGDDNGAALPAAPAAPDVNLPTVDGARFDLASQRGKVVVLEFLAPGCAGCAEGISALAEVASLASPEDVEVVVVDISGAPAADVEAYYTAVGGTEQLTYALDVDYAASLAYDVIVLGTTVVVDGSGQMRFRDEATTTAATLDEWIRAASMTT